MKHTKGRYQQEIDEALLESLASGHPTEVTPEFWAERQRELERRLTGSDRVLHGCQVLERRLNNRR